jgi:hypothetical protein
MKTRILSLLTALCLGAFAAQSQASAPVQAVDPRTDLPVRITGIEGQWKVLKAIRNSRNWVILDEFNRKNSTTTARGIAIDGSGFIYVAGESRDEGGIPSWIVRRSIDNGSTWQVVDEVRGAKPWVIGSTYEGEVFVAGSQNKLWTVRYSPNGLHWSTVDQVRGQERAVATSATILPNGHRDSWFRGRSRWKRAAPHPARARGFSA